MLHLLNKHAVSDIAPLWLDYAASHQNFDLCFQLQDISYSAVEAHILSDWFQPGHHSFGYYSSGRMIAFIRWATADFPFPHKSLIHGKILDLFVASSHRRSGIATTLFRATEDWLNKRDILRIHLSVACLNTEAIAFWSHLGFSDLVLELKRDKAERAGAANPHAFGTSGISAAEQPRMPEASGDT